MHVGRGVDAGGGQAFDRAESAAPLREGPVEQGRRLRRPLARRRRAKNDGDQPPAAMRRARDDIEARRAGEASLHAVGAGIMADQAVMGQ